MKQSISDLNKLELLTLKENTLKMELLTLKRIKNMKRFKFVNILVFCVESIIFGVYIKYFGKIDTLTVITLTALFFANFFNISGIRNCQKGLKVIQQLKKDIDTRLNYIDKYN